MELTSSMLPSGTYTMEVTSWNVHHGSYLLELTPRKLPHGTYTMEVASCKLHHGSYLVELTPWKLLHGPYTMEFTSWNLPIGETSWSSDYGSYLMELFFFFFFFFINLKRKTQQHLTYRYSYLCLSQQKKTRSHRVSAMRDTYNNMAFTMKITLHKIRSAKPWSNQPSTLSFVRWFQEFPKGIEKV